MSRSRRVLFVCMGNICRSPTAEGVMRAFVAERGLDGHVEIDSAGTIGYHSGDAADPRMRSAAAERGYELHSRARKVTEEDFERFDLVVAMDRDNLSNLRELLTRTPDPGTRRARLRLLSDYLPDGSPLDVPDPYYGGNQGFERVLDLIEEAIPRLLDELLDEWEDAASGAPS